MLSLLERLGVSPELQAFFNMRECCFSYGNEQETFGPGFHFVPVTKDLWMKGSYPATELIITPSVMEAVAYMALNAWRHPTENALSFIAVGLRPQQEQLRWMSRYCLKRKITLVFPNDLCGRLADIVIASGIRNKPVRAIWQEASVRLQVNGLTLDLAPEKVSLNTFQKAAALRTAASTRKSARFNTYLDQLLYENK